MTASKSRSETAPAAAGPGALLSRKGRPLGAAAAFAAIVILVIAGNSLDPVRNYAFDIYQRLDPRAVEILPVRIVEVDEESLQRFGQWPWPRYRMAQIIDRIAGMGALAIGLDILFAEPDRLSPEALAETPLDMPDTLRGVLRSLPTHDGILADVVASAPVVLGRAGMNGPAAAAWKNRDPFMPTVETAPEIDLSRLYRAEALLTNIDDLSFVAAGHGALDGWPDRDGVVRRVPLLINVEGAPHPSLTVEMIRVALGVEAVALDARPDGRPVTLRIGDVAVPLDPAATIRPHFSTSMAQRYVPALDLFGDTLPPDAFQGQLVLVGITGLGILDSRATPVSPSIPGVEIHAQAIETMLSGALLKRPDAMRWAEIAALAGLAALVIAIVPGMAVWAGAALALALAAGLGAAGFFLFQQTGLLFDPLLPGAGFLLVYCILGGALLSEANTARRRLAEALDRARIDAARISGELQAARQIQTGILPDPRKLAGVPGSLEVFAHLESAKEVGGDLYDLAMLDDDRLYFMVGDVTGKGVPASLFMALSKAISKGAVLRGEAAGQSLDAIMDVANEEISRENPAEMFVTVFAGILSASTGRIVFCNAGHDNPRVVSPDGAVSAIDSDGGPPLCVMEGFPYPLEEARLPPGHTLVVTTDGVTEARRSDGTLFGQERSDKAIATLAQAATLEQGCDGLIAAVRRFEDGAEATDDLTIVAIRNNGA